MPLFGPGLPGYPAGEWGCAAGLRHVPPGDVTSHRGVLRPGSETSWRAYWASRTARDRVGRRSVLQLQRHYLPLAPRSRVVNSDRGDLALPGGSGMMAAVLRAFEETLAAMPRLEAFATLSSSGCCFGKLCQFQEAGSASPALDRCGLCDAPLHCTCAAEISWPRP